MTNSEIQAIIDAAKKATQGRWKYDWGNWNVEATDFNRASVCSPNMRYCIQERALNFNIMDADQNNGEHIANTCPANIVPLLEELLEHRKKFLKSVC